MPLISTREMYGAAYGEGFAVGAFNINGVESVRAITEAAAEENSPVILQACSKARKQLGPCYIRKLVEAAVEATGVAVALHLDHGEDFETCRMFVDDGFTSVMIDGSRFGLEQNIGVTKRVVEYAHARGVPVEAELGKLAGTEGTVIVGTRESAFTDPSEAERFVRETGCDSLAVAIGTAHGAYKFEGEAKLDFERLAEIARRLRGLPLVLHGASSVPQEYVELANGYGAKFSGAKGVPEEMVRKAAGMGVCKVNVNTDLCMTMVANVRRYFTEHPQTLEPRDYLAPGREAMRALVRHKIGVFGSSGKAPAVLAQVRKGGK